MTTFSVTLAVYKNDNPLYFRSAMDSIIEQTIPPDEIVLTVDGPVTEAIDEVINDFQHKINYLKVIRMFENKGSGIAHQIGVDHCTNQLIAIMDADDIAVPDRFEKQLRCFKQYPDIDILGGYISEFINDNTKNTVGLRSVPTEDKDIKKYLKWRCPMNHVTVMFKKDAVLKAGNYQDWYYDEDSYLFCRMYLVGCVFKNIPEILCYVRVGSDMYKRRGSIKFFKSEAKLMKFILDNKIIKFHEYLINIFVRIVVQVLMPTFIRGVVFKIFFRKHLYC
jgi:glycosyltransferase involved in cell wall biosynthesis